MQTLTETESNKPSDYGQLFLPQVHERCPCLGTIQDPSTVLAYASTANHCYLLDEPLPVTFGHQQDFCLATSHTTCSVFCDNEAAALAKDRQAIGAYSPAELPAQRRWPRVVIFALLMGFVMLSMGLWQLGVTGANQWKLRLPEVSFNTAAQTIDPTSTPLSSQTAVSSAESGSMVGNTNIAATGTKEATATELPPTAEPTFTVMATSTDLSLSVSSTETPSPTNTPILFDIVTITATNTPTATAVSCGHPSSWYTYTVQPGDTASNIAQSQGLTLAQLMQANCMTTSSLFWGQVLWLPAPVIVPTTSPTIFPSPGVTAVPTQNVPATPTAFLGDDPTPAPATPFSTEPPPTELPPTEPLPTAPPSTPPPPTE